MTPIEKARAYAAAVETWQHGCSNATERPEDCIECTQALVEHIDSIAKSRQQKIASDSAVAFDMQEQFKEETHGWIQWKGTDVCMDFNCQCGFGGHIDADFVYHIRCPQCDKVYFCNGHIEMIEIISTDGAGCIHELDY
jgi:hypothetical protein